MPEFEYLNISENWLGQIKLAEKTKNQIKKRMSIKAAIIEKNEGEEVEKNEYTNLIMDDMEIKQISAEDREFLEGFVEC